MGIKGFTLIEAVLTLSVLAGGVFGVLVLYQQNIARSNEMEQTLVATELAQEKLEQIILDKKYQLYAYVIPANYLASEDLTAQGFPGYTRTISILEVNPSDMISAQTNSGYKKITVSVAVTGGLTVTLDTLVTLWGET